MAVAFSVSALARSPELGLVRTHPNDDNLSAAERYAWGRIQQGLSANFSEKCDGWPDPKQEDDPGWRDESKGKCRTLRATFIIDILTKPSFRDAMTYRGVDIRGAKIIGDVDLAFAKLDRPFQISESRFEGAISLRYAHADSIINLEGSDVGGWLDATGLHSEGELSLRRMRISRAGLVLSRAAITGLVDMSEITCLGDLNADSAKIGGSLFMRANGDNKPSFQDVWLSGANITGSIEMIGASFEGDLNANSIQVGQSVLMYSDAERKTRFRKNVNFQSADVAGQISMPGSSFDGDLSFNGAHVGADLFMRSDPHGTTTFNKVDLRGATISKQIDMSGALFNGDVDARSLHVGGSLFMNTMPEEKNRFGRINKTSFRTIKLRNASVMGLVDMSGVTLHGDLDAPFLQVGGSLLMRSLRGSRASFKNVNLSGARVTGPTDMTGAVFGGDIEADSLRVGDSLLMKSESANKAHFKNVILRGANISGQADLGGAEFDGGLDARFLQVGGALLMESHGDNAKSVFQKVDLRSAKISGEFSMGGASLGGDLYAPFLQVGGSMFMRSRGTTKASFKTVDLSNAKITGQIDFSGASLGGDLNADFIQVGGALLMRSDGNNKASFKKVNLSGATIAGGALMDGAVFGGSIVGQGLHAAGNVSLRDVYTDSPVAIPFSQLDGNLDIKGGNLASLDLRGASIAGQMQLGDKDSMVGWLDFLDLRNARVGSLSDNQFSWPKHLHLDGVSFAHLGGSEGDSGADMVKRGADWWDRNFAQLEKDFTASPYEQLAMAFGGAGYRDLADEIHYDEQVRAAEKSGVLGLTGSTLMRWGAGYGIGSYMFRALYWAIGLSLIGALILRFRVKGVADYNHGFLWCFGASANKLLPGVNLKKEFADFFDDPAHNKFTPRQEIFFVVLTALGWVLSLIVLAAFASITHGP
jgi:uncharacterized protein YjbI with pentapeptide repeats